MTAAAYLNELGRWIRSERKRLDVKQHEIAVALRVSDSAVSSWERGESEMGVTDYRLLQQFFRQRDAERLRRERNPE